MNNLYLVKTKPGQKGDYGGVIYGNVYAIFSNEDLNEYAVVQYIVENYNENYKEKFIELYTDSKEFVNNIRIENFSVKNFSKHTLYNVKKIVPKVLNVDICKEKDDYGVLELVESINTERFKKELELMNKEYDLEIRQSELERTEKQVINFLKKLSKEEFYKLIKKID